MRPSTSRAGGTRTARLSDVSRALRYLRSFERCGQLGVPRRGRRLGQARGVGTVPRRQQGGRRASRGLGRSPTASAPSPLARGSTMPRVPSFGRPPARRWSGSERAGSRDRLSRGRLGDVAESSGPAIPQIGVAGSRSQLRRCDGGRATTPARRAGRFEVWVRSALTSRRVPHCSSDWHEECCASTARLPYFAHSNSSAWTHIRQRQQPTAPAGYLMCRLMPRSSSGHSATARSADSSGLSWSAWVK